MKSEMRAYYNFDWVAVYIDGNLWHYGEDEMSFLEFAALLKDYPNGIEFHEFGIKKGKEGYNPSVRDILLEQGFKTHFFEEA